MSAVQKFLLDRLALLEALRSASNVAMVLKTEQQLVNGVLLKLATGKFLSVSDSMSMVNIVQGSALTKVNRDTLIEAVQNRIDMGPLNAVAEPCGETGMEAEPGTVAKACDKQVHDYMHNYLTQNEWTDMKRGQSVAINILARAMIRCGFLSASEPQWAFTAGLLGLVGLQTEGTDGLSLLKNLKAEHNRHKGQFDRSGLINIYPQSPKALPEPWLSLAQCHGPLVDCPFSLSERKWVQDNMRCRGGSNLKITAPAPAPARMVPNPVELGITTAVPIWFQQKCFQMWEQYKSGGVGLSQPYEEHPECRIRMVGSPTRGLAIGSASGRSLPGTIHGAQPESQGDSPMLLGGVAVPEGSPGFLGGPMAGAGAKPGLLQDPSAGTVAKPEGGLLGGAVAVPGADAQGLPGYLEATRRMLASKGFAETDGDAGQPAVATRSKLAVRKKPAAEGASKAKPKATIVKSKAQPAPSEAKPKKPECLQFPGTKKRGPLYYGRCTVYIDTKNGMWRIKKAVGERVLEHFVYKNQADSKKIWNAAATYLRRWG